MIEKNIPVPEISNEKKYPFTEMEVGDSILIKVDQAKAHTAARVHAHKSRKRGIKKTFVARKQPCGGLRIWRIE